MEINFEWPETKGGECKGKSNKKKGRSGRGKKLVGIRQRPSGRWVAEIKDTTKNKKIRMWLGTFETAEEAARAYDEAACLLRGSNTRTNFIIPQFSTNSPIASRIRTLLNNNNNNDDDDNNNKTASPKSLSSFTAAAAAADEAYYKPDMSNCNWDLSPSCSYGDDHGFSMVDEVVMKLPENTASFSEDLEDLLGFERMKVERQISASLYAMNGVHEYMEAVHDPSSQSIWDLPFFSSLQY